MRRYAWMLLLAVLPCAGDAAETAAIKQGAYVVREAGVAPGQWTMDLDAAKAAASTNRLPLFLLFTGSDWCPYCDEVRKAVFERPEWVEFAASRFVLVVIDFPRLHSLPPGMQKRNDELAVQLGIQGPPMFVLLKPDGTNVINRFGLRRDTTLYSFMRDTAAAMRAEPDWMAGVLSGLPKETAAAYRTALGEFTAAEADFLKWQATGPVSNEDNMRVLDRFIARLDRSRSDLETIERAKALSGLDAKAAQEKQDLLKRAETTARLLDDLQKAHADLDNWLLSRPAATEKNRQTLDTLSRRVADVLARVAAAK